MVTENLAMAEELVHPDHVGEPLDEATLNGLHDDLAGFSSIEDLEDFLRTFEAGSEDEATLSTQGEGDVAGDPVDTVH